MCELVVPPQTAHIVPSGTFCHAIVGTQTVLEVAIQEKFFRLETTKNAHGGFGQQAVKLLLDFFHIHSEAPFAE